jgi:serine O-acetyltransferase
LFFKLVLRHYSHKYGIQIPAGTAIGKGFYIGHFGTIVVNGNARIGDNVNISPGVIIGQQSRGRLKGVPTINDRVWIGSNAIIVGNITIGDECMIAPGAYVNFDVPARSLVMGNPGVISAGKGVDEYICNVWDK